MEETKKRVLKNRRETRDLIAVCKVTDNNTLEFFAVFCSINHMNSVTGIKTSTISSHLIDKSPVLSAGPYYAGYIPTDLNKPLDIDNLKAMALAVCGKKKDEHDAAKEKLTQNALKNNLSIALGVEDVSEEKLQQIMKILKDEPDK